MTNLLHKAYEIAEKEDVSTLPDRAVVYSVSYMPDSENKKRAERRYRTESKQNVEAGRT